jgi:polyhydroxybutyrate depolymerase
MEFNRLFSNKRFKSLAVLLLCVTTIIGCTKEDTKDDTCTNDSQAGYTTLEHNGIERAYIVYTPATYNRNRPMPIVLNFHGFGGCASQHMSTADMRAVADSDTFLLVYPQGASLNGSPHWNPSLLGGGNKSTVDDLGFVEAMLNKIAQDYNVDRDRVYAVGYSNGGMMAYGLAANKSELIAAVASVSGALLDCPSSISHPMPILHLHGTSDAVIPYTGSNAYNSVQSTLDCWINYNNTSTSPVTSSSSSNGMNIEHTVYSQGDSMVSVEHYKYNNGDHIWFENTYQGQTTAELVWSFFSRYDINGLR